MQMQVGVVVVTHGQLATELVNSAEMIVGDLPHFAAVSIGWHDDVDQAREEIGRAIERVAQSAGTDGRRAPVLVLTDMFGGTPANLGVTFVSDARRGDHRRQSADADQARAAAAGRRPADVAREMREHGRNAIWVASDLLRGEKARTAARDMTSCAVTIVNPLGLHARAAARFVHVASGFAAAIRVARGGREMDGKSIMGLLLLVGGAGQQPSRSRPTARTKSEAIAALCALVERGFDDAPSTMRAAGASTGLRVAMRLNGLGVSAGIGIGTRGRAASLDG